MRSGGGIATDNTGGNLPGNAARGGCECLPISVHQSANPRQTVIVVGLVSWLLAQFQTLDEGLVPLGIGSAQVIKQPATFADHLQQTTP